MDGWNGLSLIPRVVPLVVLNASESWGILGFPLVPVEKSGRVDNHTEGASTHPVWPGSMGPHMPFVWALFDLDFRYKTFRLKIMV